MTVSQLTEFLVADCEDTDDTAFTYALLSAAKAALLAGGGVIAPLTGGSLNGKTFTRELKLSPAEVALACRNALNLYNDAAGAGPITFFDFSRA